MALFGCASDQQFKDELSDFLFIESKLQQLDDLAIDSKCDYCNNAMRDCSLCGVVDNDSKNPIC